MDGSGGTLSTLFTSAPLGNYSYDHFTGYSPIIQASSKTGLGIANEELVFVMLQAAMWRSLCNLCLVVNRRSRLFIHHVSLAPLVAYSSWTSTNCSQVANRQRNLQIPIDDLAKGFNAQVKWEPKAS